MGELSFAIAVLWTVLGFAFYYFLAHRENHTGKVGEILAQRAWGVLFMGAITYFIIKLVFKESPGAYGLGFSFASAPPWYIYLAIPLIIVASFFQASSPGNLAMYPQIRAEKWSRKTVVLSALSWIAFLLAYEYFFRGFLLFASLSVLDTWSAIALNCALYGFAHFYKGPGETFGAIAIGVLLCYLTILTGNIWSAVMIHSVMALSNEWFSLHFHPDMKVEMK